MEEKAACWYRLFELTSATIIVMSMVVVLTLQVFFRYVVRQPLYWSEELARFLMIWSVFFGAVFAFNRGSHLNIDVLVKILPKRVQVFTLILKNIIVILFSALLIVIGSRFILKFTTIFSPALAIPLSAVYSVLPFTSVLNILVVAGKMKRDIGEILCS